MKVPIIVKTEKEQVFDIQFPLYRKLDLDTVTYYMKVIQIKNNLVEYTVVIDIDGQGIELKIDKNYHFGSGDIDYHLGKGFHSSSEYEFQNALNKAKNMLKKVRSDEL